MLSVCDVLGACWAWRTQGERDKTPVLASRSEQSVGEDTRLICGHVRSALPERRPRQLTALDDSPGWWQRGLRALSEGEIEWSHAKGGWD